MLDKNDDYKPTEIDDIVFGESAAEKLIKEIVSGQRPFPSAGTNGIVLYGPNGTGKSALAGILPAAIESYHKSKYGIYDNNKPIVREYRMFKGMDMKTLINNVMSITSLVPGDNFHYLIFDEFDNIDRAYMDSFKSVMNCDTAIFILTTNNLSKLERGILSRSHVVSFSAAPAQKWLPVVKSIMHDQCVIAPSDAKLCEIIAKRLGDARKIVGDAVHLASELRANGHIVVNSAVATDHMNTDDPDLLAA